jgi:hypothetical protein
MEFRSLYEYLGHAAGSDLGKRVATAAVAQGVAIQTQEISNPKYSGTVMMYPVDFLDQYFGKDAQPEQPTVQDILDDELPF